MRFKFWQKKEIKNQSSVLMDILCGGYSHAEINSFIKFYFEACPVFTATKYIADAISAIPIILEDKKGDFIYEHKVLNLLKNPNPFTDGSLFLKELSAFYVLTGNAYIDITGEKEPIELNIISPNCISIQAASDGYAEIYSRSSNSSNSQFIRQQDKRFIDKRGNEIIHLRDFNPNFSTELTGASSFAGCQLEISQYVLTSIHNNALLNNGARPSGILTYKGNDMSPEQAQGLKQIINEKLSGARNAGSPAFFSGDIQWQQISESMRDMDFPTLKKSVSEAIYSAVKIPLPMISPENMSFANMDASKYLFYDNAVLPIFKRILDFLTRKLLTRYKQTENLKFSFDLSSIEALENRKLESVKTLAEIGILSNNELRTIIGFEAISGGDTIYKPANSLPIGQDIYTEDNRDTPASKSEKAEYIKLMTSIRAINGERLYSDELIKKHLKTFYE
jgi:HK97 family phage portal protein